MSSRKIVEMGRRMKYNIPRLVSADYERTKSVKISGATPLSSL